MKTAPRPTTCSPTSIPSSTCTRPSRSRPVLTLRRWNSIGSRPPPPPARAPPRRPPPPPGLIAIADHGLHRHDRSGLAAADRDLEAGEHVGLEHTIGIGDFGA